MASILQAYQKRTTMNAKHKIYDPATFDEEHLTCPKCAWDGSGSEAQVAGFYGISKFKEVLCPKCGEYLGNLSRDGLRGREDRLESQIGPI